MPVDSPIHELSGWRRALLWPLAALLRGWGATLRFELTETTATLLAKCDEPVAFVIWHNRLFLAAEIYRRYRRGRRLCAVISASQDGAWLAAFFSLVGMHAVRGSSSRRGAAAAAGLLAALRAGHDVGVTPDGPRGPCYAFKPGAVRLSGAAGAPLLLVGCRYVSAWRLRSWDRFYLPQPFSRLVVGCLLVKVSPGGEVDPAAWGAQLRALNPD